MKYLFTVLLYKSYYRKNIKRNVKNTLIVEDIEFLHFYTIEVAPHYSICPYPHSTYFFSFLSFLFSFSFFFDLRSLSFFSALTVLLFFRSVLLQPRAASEPFSDPHSFAIISVAVEKAGSFH